ncbi:complement C1q-like protein 4 [Argopecten irradians]|uniref:complement C1q-like protein 4 n=1 Tax=Argopecten irradians TaxID=31199 RepID=UPI0037111FB5
MSLKVLQIFCCFVMTALVTCDDDITKEALSSLQQQVHTLQTAFQRQNERMEHLEAENKELKDYLHSLSSTQQKRGYPISSQSIGFYAKLSTTTALGDHQIIVFDIVVTNDGNGYDSRHGHFTAPVSGLYAFSLTAMNHGSERGIHAAIIKEGQLIGDVVTNGDTYETGSNFAIVRLQAGEMVWVEHYFDPPGLNIHGNGHSDFSGFLIQAY